MSKTTVTLDGKTWTLDEDDLTLQDAFLIKSGTGLALKPFFQGLADMDPHALQGLVWFLRRKDGEQIGIGEVDFKVTALKVDQDEDPTGAEATSSGSSATA